MHASAGTTEDNRRALACFVAALAPVVLVAVSAWLGFGNFDRFMIALDRASALGPCHAADGAKPLCDFANHYYPQGQALAHGGVVVPGFYYSAFFAVVMRAFAFLPYSVARGVWAAIVVTAALALLAAPLFLGVRRRLLAWAIYGFAFACSLPVWHDLAFGQVSSILTALVVFAFVAYDAKRSVLAAVLVGIAAAIKFYPALFAVYFLIRGDRRAVIAFVATVFVCMAAIPLAVLGETGFVAFYTSLWTSMQRFSAGVAASPFSSFIANAIDHVVTGRSNPSSLLYKLAVATGLGVALLHSVLAWRQNRAQPRCTTVLMLGFATLPFVVRSCWVHYFVFVPMLAFWLLDAPSETKTPAHRLSSAAVIVAVALLSVPALWSIGDHVYENALPFWAIVLMLPALYRRAIGSVEGR